MAAQDCHAVAGMVTGIARRQRREGRGDSREATYGVLLLLC
jgi:hypothetical protein